MQPSPIDVTERPWVPSARRASFSIDCSSRSCERSKYGLVLARRPQRHVQTAGGRIMPHNLGLAQLQEERLAPCVTISAKARSRPELGLSVTGFSHVDLVLRRQGVARAVFSLPLPPTTTARSCRCWHRQIGTSPVGGVPPTRQACPQTSVEARRGHPANAAPRRRRCASGDRRRIEEGERVLE